MCISPPFHCHFSHKNPRFAGVVLLSDFRVSSEVAGPCSFHLRLQTQAFTSLPLIKHAPHPCSDLNNRSLPCCAGLSALPIPAAVVLPISVNRPAAPCPSHPHGPASENPPQTSPASSRPRCSGFFSWLPAKCYLPEVIVTLLAGFGTG